MSSSVLAYPRFHPAPLLRLARITLRIAWGMASLNRRPHVFPAVQAWAEKCVPDLGVRVVLLAPIPPGGQLWVSNHISWVDTIVFWSLRGSRMMAKVEVKGYPIFGRIAQRLGLSFVKRESVFNRAAALRRLRTDLESGDDFLAFPEGTTTSGQGLAPLQEGVLRLAYRMGVKVLPFRIACDDARYPWIGDADLISHLWGMVRSQDIRVSVRPGEVLDPARYGDEEAWVRAIRSHLEP